MPEASPKSIESPLIGSGSQEEVDNRVNTILHMGTSRGYLTYEELNERLPDEVVSPDKLDTLLMKMDEMGIKLIDEQDVGEFQQTPKQSASTQHHPGEKGAGGKGAHPKAGEPAEEEVVEEEEEEEIDLNLEAE